MKQLSATVRQNSDNAMQANKLDSSASEVAKLGGHSVCEVVATMRDINDSSQKIGDSDSDCHRVFSRPCLAGEKRERDVEGAVEGHVAEQSR